MNTIRKSLIIGLGGTGRDAVLHAKRRCIDVYGEVPPTTRFLVIDTTDSESLQVPGQDPIELDKGEFRRLRVYDPATLITQPEVKPWFPDSKVSLRAITSGAGQVRALGRLALYSDTSVLGVMSKSVKEVGSWKPTREAEESSRFELFDDGERIFVSIVTSLAGGTGSGMFLDIAFLLRSILQKNAVITGYFLLPDVFTSKPGTRHVKANAYAALLELDHHMNFDPGKPEYRTAFEFGGKRIRITKPPFDVVQLIGDRTRNGTVYPDLEDLTDFLGYALYVSMGAGGKKAGDTWDNLQNQIADQRLWNGKSAHYVSYGLSEFVYDARPFIYRHSRKTVAKLLERLFFSDNRKIGYNAEAQVSQFINDNAIDKDSNLGLRLCSDNNWFEPREPSERKESTVQAYYLKIRHSWANHRIEMGTSTEDKTDEVLAATVEALANFLYREHSDGGLDRSMSFLKALTTKLDELADSNDVEDIKKKANDAESEFERLGDDIQKTKPGFGLKQRTWTKKLETIKTISQRMVSRGRDQARQQAKIRFYRKASTHVNEVWKELDRFKSSMHTLRVNLEREASRGYRDERGKKPFVKVFSPSDKTPRVDTSEFWRVVRGQNVWRMEMAEIRRCLFKVVVTNPDIHKAKNGTVEEELRKSGDVVKQLNQLVRMAEPLWNYNSAYVTGGRKTELIHLLGVKDDENSIVKSHIIDTGEHPPEVMATGDSKRITCLKLEAAIPAFVLEGIEEYRDLFVRGQEDAQFTYLTDKRFSVRSFMDGTDGDGRDPDNSDKVNLVDLEDIIPDEDDNNSDSGSDRQDTDEA